MTGLAPVAGLATALVILLGAPVPWRSLASEDHPTAAPTASPGPRRLAGALVGLGSLGWWLVVASPPWVPATALPVVAVLAAAAVAGTRLRARHGHRRAASARGDRVLEACELLATELASGLPPGRALERAAAGEPLLGAAGSAERLGADVAGALRGSATAPGAGGLARVAAAWDVSRRTGQRLAPAVASAADALRRDRATRRLIDAELASARATARMLAALPLLALLMGGGAGGEPWAFLLGTSPGVACLAVGLGLELVGLAWIERITASAEAAR